MDSGCETHHQPVVNSDGYVMPRVCKEFPGKFRIDWIVEHIFGGVHQNAVVAALQHLDLDGHRVASTVYPIMQGIEAVSVSTEQSVAASEMELSESAWLVRNIVLTSYPSLPTRQSGI
jgi:hypothetical protein